MRSFWPRLLKSVLPVSVVCGAAGYLYAVAAGAYIADERTDGGELRDALVVRVPLAMAVWGGGVTLLVEFFRHLWAVKANQPPTAPAPTPEADAEKLLLQLLEQAEAVERARLNTPPESRPAPATPPAVTDTPLPAALSAIDGQPTAAS